MIGLRAKKNPIMIKKMSQEGLARLERYEGKRLDAYQDAAGKSTIGVGHLIKEDENFIHITEEQCIELLQQDVKNSEYVVNSLVRVELTQDQFDSLVSFVFNVGSKSFMNSSLLKAINEGAAHETIRQDFMKWNKIHIGGVIIINEGLSARRAGEASHWKG